MEPMDRTRQGCAEEKTLGRGRPEGDETACRALGPVYGVPSHTRPPVLGCTHRGR